MLTTIQRPLDTSPCVKHAIFITAGFTRQGRNTSNYNSNEINILILLLFSRFRRRAEASVVFLLCKCLKFLAEDTLSVPVCVFSILLACQR